MLLLLIFFSDLYPRLSRDDHCYSRLNRGETWPFSDRLVDCRAFVCPRGVNRECFDFFGAIIIRKTREIVAPKSNTGSELDT